MKEAASHLSAATDRLSGRALRIGVSVGGGPFVEHNLGTNAQVVLGPGGPGVIAVRNWTTPNLCVVSAHRWLHLGPGMSVVMVHETGEGRLEGTFEDLLGAGVEFPLFMNANRIKVRVREGLVMLMEYA